eukprot:GHVS01103267.1.p1 GENE.GHVS01103267.1~~GHVS01103267.1.p1  ORF type:complete len:250 (+),score=47.69 GHVS01103267.1:261-1010(+)
MTTRAAELCLLPPQGNSLVLDVGCGSGLSGEVLTGLGHQWIGVDLSPDMLAVSVDNETEGDVLLADIGQLVRFRPGTFDGAISISTLQWLCNADKASHDPYKRLLCFFRWLHDALKRGARAVFQFYPQSASQAEMITAASVRAGFGGGLVVDFPNSAKAKKYYLCLWTGVSGSSLPPAVSHEAEDYSEHHTAVAVENTTRERPAKRSKHARKNTHDKEWVLHKKARQRTLGHKVRPDTKYTGRKRNNKF